MGWGGFRLRYGADEGFVEGVNDDRGTQKNPLYVRCQNKLHATYEKGFYLVLPF